MPGIFRTRFASGPHAPETKWRVRSHDKIIAATTKPSRSASESGFELVVKRRISEVSNR
jgi:hypothetical protein